MPAAVHGSASPWRVVPALGIAQILAWSSSYYLPAVIAGPVSASTGWPLAWTVGGLSLGLLASGLIAPWVGNRIERAGGRPVLALSAVLLALGLAGAALATLLIVYLAAWIVIGLGMGAGLYDAAFAALGRTYGERARQPITALTLFGGFASTVGWPLAAYLVDTVDWRGACWAFAALNLLVTLPLYLLALPREAIRPDSPSDAGRPAATHAAAPSRAIFLLLAISFTLPNVIWSVLSVHFVTILKAQGVGLAAAVTLGALVGPSQVAARALEFALGRFHHPIWTLAASALLTAFGIAFISLGAPLLAAGFILYGAGGGLRSIARGTLPLALFGGEGYAALMGRLAMPTLLVQAVSPPAAAFLLDGAGAAATLRLLLAIAIAGLAVAAVLWAAARPRIRTQRARSDAASSAIAKEEVSPGDSIP